MHLTLKYLKILIFYCKSQIKSKTFQFRSKDHFSHISCFVRNYTKLKILIFILSLIFVIVKISMTYDKDNKKWLGNKLGK